MMACALPGCNKPTSGTHLACGEHHHFLLMDSRYSSCRSKQSLISQISPHLCAFSPCNKPPSSHDHCCCSKPHYLSWLKRSYASLRRDQICQLPDCNRHVFVELHDDGSLEVYDFCGWRHCQQFYIRSALRSFEEKCMGQESSVESHMESLKDYVLDKSNRPRNMEVYEDFFFKHPSDVLDRPDVEYCWLIARCIWKENDSSKRELITKNDYHWKQQGKVSRYSNEISKRYLTYTKLGKKRKRSNEKDEMQAFTMLEYTWVGAGNFKDYCLVRLKVPQSQARKRATISKKKQEEDVESNNKLSEAVESSNKQARIGNAIEGAGDNNYHEQPVYNSQIDVVESNNEQSSIENLAQDAVDRNPEQAFNYWPLIPVCQDYCRQYDLPRTVLIDCDFLENSWPDDYSSNYTDSVLPELQWFFGEQAF